jgi:hypothetical protein
VSAKRQAVKYSPPKRRRRMHATSAQIARATRIGLVATVIATIADLVLAALLRSILDVPGGFTPLQVGPVSFMVLAAGVTGVIVFDLLALYSARPHHWFRITAAVVTLLSLASPLSLLLTDPPRVPGTSGVNVAAAIVLHLVPPLILVGLLRRRSGIPA